jgi:uncharacterized protein YjbI with pentapeptide repeats
MARLPGRIAARPHSVPPRAKAAKPVETDPKLQELKDQAEDLGTARKALDDAVSMTRGLWISFISLSAYLMVAVGSVTHVDLFLENPLQLPLVGVKVPLVVFFWLAPILYLIVHNYLLLNLKLMSDNVRTWQSRLEAVLLKETRIEECERIADEHRLTLPNFFPVQMLSAPKFNRRGFIGWALSASVLITVVVGPVLLLFLFQTQFLPYHAEAVTWVHRISIIVDMAAVWYFWPKIHNRVSDRLSLAAKFLTVSASGALVLLSVIVATFPSELVYLSKNGVRDVLFEGGIDNLKGIPTSLFANRLVLTNTSFVKMDDEALAKVATTLPLRGRHLENVVLVHADLRKADFSGARMDGAILSESRLDEADFRCGTLPVGMPRNRLYTNIKCANLKNATFDRASLFGANFENADLEGASFREAKLQDVNFKSARMDGTNFRYAILVGADFTDARLNGATLDNSISRGVAFRRSKLVGTSFRNSNLSGANFASADLDGILFFRSNLDGAHFENASLRGAMILRSNLRNAYFSDNRWEHAVLQDEVVDGLTTNGQEWPAYANAVTSSAKENQDHSNIADQPEAGASGSQIGDSQTADEKWHGISRSALKLPTNIESKVWRSKGWQDRIAFIGILACTTDNLPFVINSLTFLPRHGRSDPDESQIFSSGPYRPVLARFFLDPHKCPNGAKVHFLVKYQLDIWACQPSLPDVSLPSQDPEQAPILPTFCSKAELATGKAQIP